MNDPADEEREEITTTLGDLVAAVYDVCDTPEEALVVLARCLALAEAPVRRLPV